MSEVSRSTVRTRTWPAWAGSISELYKIGKEAQNLYLQRRTTVLDQYDRETERIVQELRDSGDEHLADLRAERRRDDRKRVEDRWVFTVTLTDGVEEVTGPLDTVFPEFDRRVHNKVIFRGSIETYEMNRPDSIRVEFERKHVTPGFLTISSFDPGWGRQAMSKMSDEIGAGSPWWAFLHQASGRALYVFASWQAIFWSVVLLLSPIQPPAHSPVVKYVYYVALLAVIATVPIWAVNTKRFLEWAAPSFEVHDGERSTGTRFFIYLAGLAVTFIAGIIVNRVS